MWRVDGDPALLRGDVTAGALLHTAAAAHRNEDVMRQDGAAHTYGELDSAAATLAAGLQSLSLCLYAHPKVKVAQVVGVPDRVYEEAVALFVELRPGETATERDIQDYCRQHLARFKVPKHVWIIPGSEWPITGPEKIQSFKLRERAMRELGLNA